MNISKEGVDLIKKFEGCELDAYKCAAGVWTIAYGRIKEVKEASTMLKVLNSGEYKSVPEQIKRWNKAGGKVLEGLTRRRNAEALLFEGKDWEQA